jgi:putative bacteriocin export ABC transporter, lactococcin 972 group
MTILKMENINKRYDTKIVLKDVSLTFEKGKMYAITGASGSGKSTLLNIMGLLEKPTSGNLYISNHKNVKISSKLSKKLLRNTISYLFQNYALSDNDTVEYNLKMGLYYSKNINKKDAIKQALQKVGLEGFEKIKISKLSGGEQQRVSLARLLLKPSEIILADEPTGNLDNVNKQIVMDLLKDLNKEGKTVIIVTHDLNLAKQCDEIIQLETHKH